MTPTVRAQPLAARPRVLGISSEIVIGLFLLAITLGVRITNLGYNTLFVDEAIYVQVGQDLWQGRFDQNATEWMYGSYLYPGLAAVLDAWGGAGGLRLASAVMITIAIGVVFLATTYLFDNRAAPWTILVLSLTPISIDLGQFAVQDTLAVLFLCITVFCLVKASCASGLAQSMFLNSATLGFVLATVTKYFVALYLPAALLVALACYLAQNRPVRSLFTRFLLPASAALILYATYYHEDLRVLFSGPFGFQSGSRLAIAGIVWNEIGLVCLLALAGLVMLAWEYRTQRDQGQRHRVLLWTMLTPLIATSLFAGLVYHLAAANAHSAWKHTVYSLVFVAPLAGYACARIVAAAGARMTRWSITGRLAGAALTSLMLVWLAQGALDRNWGFQHSWPNTSAVLAHLRSAGFSTDQRVLAEGAQVYAYYLGRGDDTTWQDTWYMQYGDLLDQPAMLAAVRDGWFDTVILDDYYTPGLRRVLEPALLESGYRVTFEESQRLSSGETILIRVYARSADRSSSQEPL